MCNNYDENQNQMVLAVYIVSVDMSPTWRVYVQDDEVMASGSENMDGSDAMTQSVTSLGSDMDEVGGFWHLTKAFIFLEFWLILLAL